MLVYFTHEPFLVNVRNRDIKRSYSAYDKRYVINFIRNDTPEQNLLVTSFSSQEACDRAIRLIAESRLAGKKSLRIRGDGSEEPETTPNPIDEGEEK